MYQSDPINIREILASMAWERAKAELQSYMHALSYHDRERFTEANKKIEKFIADFEENCL